VLRSKHHTGKSPDNIADGFYFNPVNREHFCFVTGTADSNVLFPVTFDYVSANPEIIGREID
jgi:hypothetical protein